ncbi:hypothetical protein F5X99DRAFT_404869 [Biscogniauxia marginata]|nr:hypothetical protein F5X99DRAFT_404869 [Biscogniauxia marginata]
MALSSTEIRAMMAQRQKELDELHRLDKDYQIGNASLALDDEIGQMKKVFSKNRTVELKLQERIRHLEKCVKKAETFVGRSDRESDIATLRETSRETSRGLSQATFDHALLIVNSRKTDLDAIRNISPAYKNALGRLEAADRVRERDAIITRLENDVNRLEGERDTSNSDLSATLDRLGRVESDLGEQSNQFAAARQKCDEQAGVIRTLRSEASELERQLTTANKSLSDRTEQLSTANRSLADRTEQLSSALRNIPRRDAIIGRLNAEISELEEKLSTANSDISARQSEVGRLTGDISNLRQQLASTSQKASDSEADAARLTNDANRLREQLAAADKKIATYGGDVTKLINDASDLAKQLATSNNEISARDNTISRLQAESEVRSMSLKESEASLDRERSDATQLRERIRAADEEKNDFIRQRDEAELATARHFAREAEGDFERDQDEWRTFAQTVLKSDYVTGDGLAPERRPWTVRQSWLGQNGNLYALEYRGIVHTAGRLYARLLEERLNNETVLLLSQLFATTVDSRPAGEEGICVQLLVFAFWQLVALVQARWPGAREIDNRLFEIRSRVESSTLQALHTSLCNPQPENVLRCQEAGVDILVLPSVRDYVFVVDSDRRSVTMTSTAAGTFDGEGTFKILAPEGEQDVVLSNPSLQETEWILINWHADP